MARAKLRMRAGKIVFGGRLLARGRLLPCTVLGRYEYEFTGAFAKSVANRKKGVRVRVLVLYCTVLQRYLYYFRPPRVQYEYEYEFLGGDAHRSGDRR